MKGDSIVIKEHHKESAQGVCELILPDIETLKDRFTISIAGESGSGKSEIAAALAKELLTNGFESIIFQQDDYFVYPPKTNDRTRRQDIKWVGPQEVHLDLLDKHLKSFLHGDSYVDKPLVHYAQDSITQTRLQFNHARIAIAEGTYTSLLNNINRRVFIDRDYRDTQKHRERRMRDTSELDEFTNSVLAIEHEIISSHKEKADIVVNKNYWVRPFDESGE